LSKNLLKVKNNCQFENDLNSQIIKNAAKMTVEPTRWTIGNQITTYIGVIGLEQQFLLQMMEFYQLQVLQ